MRAKDFISSKTDLKNRDKLSTFKNSERDFPGGAVVKNPRASAGDTGSSPGPGRTHMPRNNWAREPQLLKPARLEPVFRNKRSHRNEKPAHGNEEQPPLAAATKTQHSQK